MVGQSASGEGKRDGRLEDGKLPEEKSQSENTCWEGEGDPETDNAGTSRYIALLHQHPSVGSVATPFRTHPVPQQQSWSIRDHGVWMYGGVNRLHGCASHGERSR